MADVPQEQRIQAVREQVIEQLTLSYAHSNLDEKEFERRLSRATNSESASELMTLVRDLPAVSEKRASARPESEFDVALNPGIVREEGTLFAILGGTKRKGVWQPPRHLHVVAMLGGVELDFSQAEMPPGTTEVTVFTIMGGIEITVPPGLNVDVSGVPLMGGFDDKSAGTVDPDAPTLRVRGVAVMGGVEVKVPRRYRKMLNDLRRTHELRRRPDRRSR